MPGIWVNCGHSELIIDTLILKKELQAEPSGYGEDVISSRPPLSSHSWLFRAAAFFSVHTQVGF